MYIFDEWRDKHGMDYLDSAGYEEEYDEDEEEYDEDEEEYDEDEEEE